MVLILGTSSLEFRETKKSISHTFMVYIHTTPRKSKLRELLPFCSTRDFCSLWVPLRIPALWFNKQMCRPNQAPHLDNVYNPDRPPRTQKPMGFSQGAKQVKMITSPNTQSQVGMVCGLNETTILHYYWIWKLHSPSRNVYNHMAPAVVFPSSVY